MATQLTPPSSQKNGDRPLSFLLDNQADGEQEFVALHVRPEELTRTDPSRAVVHQTLGGAWVDAFGAGLAQITISGHTGWRRDANDDLDGLARFQALKTSVFDQWHAFREKNIERGLDPDLVRLIFTDKLDERACTVAPMSFTLRRSRTRPLLAQYQIQMTVVSESILHVDPVIPYGYLPVAPDMVELTEELALESIEGSVSLLEELLGNVARTTSFLGSLRQLVANEFVAPVAAFLQTTIDIYKSIRGAIAEGTALAGDLISIARMSAQAGINLFRSLAAVLSIPKIAKAALVAVASAYMNIFCTLRNALSLKVFVEDYSSLYGASNCSSTAGGRPHSTFAGRNPFYSVVPTPGPMPVNLTPAAAVQLQLLAQHDPVLSPLPPAALLSSVETIEAGFQANQYLARYTGRAAPLPLFRRPGEAEDRLNVIVNETLPENFGALA